MSRSVPVATFARRKITNRWLRFRSFVRSSVLFRNSGNLKEHCNQVIFANGPVYAVPLHKRITGAKPTENHAMKLADTYMSVLSTAKTLGVRTLVCVCPLSIVHCVAGAEMLVCCDRQCLPGISTGVHGYPVSEAAPIAVRTVRQWLQSEGNGDAFDLIVFVVYTSDEEGYQHYEHALEASFPRSCVGSPLEDLDVDIDASTEGEILGSSGAAGSIA
jgi:O-acetyl-ADP-ribose deacetylase (regulator of RNase III)